MVELSVSTVLLIWEHRQKRVWKRHQNKHPGRVQLFRISTFSLIVPRINWLRQSPEHNAVPGEVQIGLSQTPRGRLQCHCEALFMKGMTVIMFYSSSAGLMSQDGGSQMSHDREASNALGRDFRARPRSAFLEVSRSGGPASGSPLRVFLPSPFVYPCANVNFPEMIEIPFSPTGKS